MNRIFTFAHRARLVEFGPYTELSEAKEAFQRAYGYWPEAPVEVELYAVRKGVV